LQGTIRGKPVRTTISNKAAPCPLDHVNRQFHTPAPNRLWVSDFTYVATWTGLVYIGFVIDVYARYRGLARQQDCPYQLRAGCTKPSPHNPATRVLAEFVKTIYCYH
jgi:hypothetical protein